MLEINNALFEFSARPTAIMIWKSLASQLLILPLQLVIALTWTFVSSPLIGLGGIIGKNSKAEFQAPCRAAEYPGEIPPLRWYRRTVSSNGNCGISAIHSYTHRTLLHLC
ncbi:hypothetical protein POTOM_042856 [Populus tomentosa]|uniref:Transmembrane 9 superfamily member n=1 Tax=Populus tomentosa TaxID=118781 RepID=A0A8X7YHC4_POPTO|nr:hypothetical protein POTOM_042856 [Populus tomentosa]